MALNIASPSLSSVPIRNVSQKSFSLKAITCLVGKTRVRATKGVSSVCEPLPPDRPLWFPGSSPPPWLDGSLPGDFGFDPLGLGSDPESLRWFAQAELMHARWAMLAVAGILIPEWLENLGFIENFNWFDAGAREYFADPTTLFVVQLALMGWVEGRRWVDIINPGCVDIEPKLPHITKPKTDVGYPGGLWFDPLMWGMGSPEPVMVLRTKEIKNGRLAMLAFVGFWFQHIYTGQSPLENLQAHLADPGFHFTLMLMIRAGLERNPPLMWSQINTGNTGMLVVLGWTEEAMISGARDIGLSPAIVGTFPRKEAALVEMELIQRWRTSLMEKISFI